MRAAGLFFRAVGPLAGALKAKLAAAGIRPIVDCDNPQVVVSRQIAGRRGILLRRQCRVG